MTATRREFDGRVALVIGASRGIGAATARALAAAGADVVLAARDEVALRALADEIGGQGGSASVVPTDVRQPESVHRLVEQILGAHGRLDAAVNAAAAAGHGPTPLADVAVADFDNTLAVDLRGLFLAMKYEISAMLHGDGGAIVNVGSTAADRPVAGLSGYVAGKSALIGLTRTAALDYAAAGIRVNAVAPGPVLTERLAHAGPAAQDRVVASLPARRLGRPEDVAGAVVWLCGPSADFVTGVTLPIDGGLLAGMPPFAQPTDAARERP